MKKSNKSLPKIDSLINKILLILSTPSQSHSENSKSIQLCEKILSDIYPEAPDMPCELICDNLLSKQPDKAEQNLKNARTHYPNIKAFEFLEAIIKTYQGGFLQAKQIFQKLFKEEPQNNSYQECYYATIVCQYTNHKPGNEETLSKWNQTREFIKQPQIKQYCIPALHIIQLHQELSDFLLQFHSASKIKEMEQLKNLLENIPNQKELLNLNAKIADEMIAHLPIDKNQNSNYATLLNEITDLFSSKNSAISSNASLFEKYFNKLTNFSTYSNDLMRQINIHLRSETKNLESTLVNPEKDSLDKNTISNILEDMFQKYHKLNREIQPKTRAQSAKEQNKDTLPEKEKTEPYEIFLSDPSGIGTQEITATEEKHNKYKDKKEEYDIFIYRRDVYIKKNKAPLHLDRIAYNLLILFLRYKDKPLPPIPLSRRVKFDNLNAEYTSDKTTAHNEIKPFITDLRNKLESISTLNIKKIRHQPIKCNGKFKFCVILLKEEAKNYYLSEGALADFE